MRIYTRYKAIQRPRSRRPKGNKTRWVYLILALALLGAAIWCYREYELIPATKTLPARPRRRGKPSIEPKPLNSLANHGVAAKVRRGKPAANTNGAAPAAPIEAQPKRPAATVLELQLALVHQGISPGPIDGVMGWQTRAALRAFQEKARLPATGVLDGETVARLEIPAPEKIEYQVTADDLARLHPVGKTWLEKSLQPRLDYETLLELAAERGQASQALERQLNAGLDWSRVQPGQKIWIPNASFPKPLAKAKFIRIKLSEKSLEAFDAQTNLLAHFPCSIAQRVEKRPIGKLLVQSVIFNPNYRFDPAIFPESEEGRRLGRKLILPPGPNNPVGVAWIGLNKPGYGIHGTPRPELVGRTESHGCFRLANWCAEYLANMVEKGTIVTVEP